MTGYAIMAGPKKGTGRGGRKSQAAAPPPPPDVPLPAEDEPHPPIEELGELTATKCYEEQRDMLSQIGQLTGLNQQEVMLRYWNVMSRDLFHLMALRRARIEALQSQSRPGG